MLNELRVENLLLIERAELRLGPGLNVITGETGAGKTVLAHALDLLLGGRPRSGIVRPGAGEAYVEGAFELPEQLPAAIAERLPEGAGELVLARRVGADGRTRAYLNGRAAGVAELRELAAALLSFHGQHEHRRLTLAGEQLRILDARCGPDQPRRLSECASAFARVRELEGRIAELHELEGSRERELGLLDYELGEIDQLAPDPDEHTRLLAARERLRRSDALLGAAGAAADALSPEDAERTGAVQQLAAAATALAAVGEIDASLDALAERLHAVAIESQELTGELRRYAEQGFDEMVALDMPGLEPTLEAVEERLAGLERLMRKHGGSIESVLDHARAARARREQLAGAQSALEQAGTELAAARAELDGHVRALRRARGRAAGAFAAEVQQQLAALAMADASFDVALGETDPTPAGGDAVEFLIAPNPGVPAGPLREIASGGELSRVMLAILSAAADAAPGSTLVFDEVDAGVGGRTANAVGARLQALAGASQVLCITHLPQIASLAERHFAIVKETGAETALTNVIQLQEKDVVAELVRMLGADSDDPAARRHARDLRRAA